MSESAPMWQETFRGVVFPWHCDQFGHMNARFYAHHFDDASFHLWTRIGFGPSRMASDGLVPVTAQTTLDYRHELRSGEPFLVESAFVHAGNKSVRSRHRMLQAEHGALCATMHVVEVFMNLETRESVPMADVRALVVERLVPDPYE